MRIVPGKLCKKIKIIVMQSKTVKNKVLFNKVIKSLEKYNQLNNSKDKLIDTIDDVYLNNNKEYNKLSNKCTIAFDKYLELLNELPKYEQIRIEKSDLYLIG